MEIASWTSLNFYNHTGEVSVISPLAKRKENLFNSINFLKQGSKEVLYNNSDDFFSKVSELFYINPFPKLIDYG